MPHSRTVGCLAVVLSVGILAGCAAQRPVLYPNDHYKQTGALAAKADVDDCMQLAKLHGNKADQTGKVATGTAVGAGVGAATGAAVGAVLGRVGTGAATGAVGGAMGGLIKGAFSANEPEPIFKNFVDRCLTERGYEPIGWK